MENDSRRGLTERRILWLVAGVFLLILGVIYGTQYAVEQGRAPAAQTPAERKTEYEIGKLDAEIRQIRSDTAGSLFWLKLVALFVTVGGAVGGYLVGQSRTTQARLSFEDRKVVDEVFQSIIQELADASPILRAAAAVKLGSVLKSFPAEWNVSEARKEQIRQLTKQVLAAALAIETDKKVLKTLTINLVLHKLKPEDELASVQGVDLSGARAYDAYWARCDFSYADFYAAELARASFRRACLAGAQFRECDLKEAVLDGTVCTGANFKLADLRGASFRGATLNGTNFEGAKVFGVSLAEAVIESLPDCQVDMSEHGNGSLLVPVSQWAPETAVRRRHGRIGLN